MRMRWPRHGGGVPRLASSCVPRGQGLSHALLITKWVHHVFTGLAKLVARSVLAVMACNHTVVTSPRGVASVASACLVMAFLMGLERSQPRCSPRCAWRCGVAVW